MPNQYVGEADPLEEVDAFAYDTRNYVWNGAAYVPWADADFAMYRIEVTQDGTSGMRKADLPHGCARFELRLRGATLEDSGVVWNERLPTLVVSLP